MKQIKIMKREIIFRGKDLRTNKWTYGWFVPILGEADSILVKDVRRGVSENMAPFTYSYSRVKSSTIGQYTGIKDKNGTKIFEGDILKDNDVCFTVFYADGGFAIESNPTHFGYGYQGGSNPRESLSDMQTGSYVESNCEVVGNIFDNKSLLK